MKKLIVILIFLTSNLFGQHPPMLDSLDYYKRNRIKAVHYYLNSWDSFPGWKYIKFSFDKRTSSLVCDSIGYENTSSYFARNLKTFGVRSLSLNDTVYHRNGLFYFLQLKHNFDNKGRLTKKN